MRACRRASEPGSPTRMSQSAGPRARGAASRPSQARPSLARPASQRIAWRSDREVAGIPGGLHLGAVLARPRG